jgi:apolipoprotein D and lipocalin family protein
MRNLIFLFLFACGSADYSPKTHKIMEKVDLQKFMGKWYVLGHIPLSIEKNAYEAIETYTLLKKDRVFVEFKYKDGGFDEPWDDLTQRGYIMNTKTNSFWKVSPIWPLKFDYLLHYVDAKYSFTIIGVPDRENVWVMAREKYMSKKKWAFVKKKLIDLGYDTKKFRFIPHEVNPYFEDKIIKKWN